jgi:regulator of sigma E protease
MPILGFGLENIGYTMMVVFGVGLLIFVHELGHFLAAKWAGVRVEAFSMGFGPPIYKKKRGDTVYQLSLLPIGGYVKMAGENPGEGNEDDPGNLQKVSIPWRFLIFSGGVLMNLLFALVAFPLVFNNGVAFNAPVLGTVVPGSPAWEAGLEEGDRILEINGAAVHSFQKVFTEVALSNEKGLLFRVKKTDGKEIQVQIKARFMEESGLQQIGIGPATAKDVGVELPKEQSVESSAQSGLQKGDILVSLNGKPFGVKVWDQFTQEVSLHPEDWISGKKKLRVGVRRNGSIRVITIPGKKRILKDQKKVGIQVPKARIAGLRGSLKTWNKLGVGNVFIEGRIGTKRIPILGEEDLREVLSTPMQSGPCLLVVRRTTEKTSEMGNSPISELEVPDRFRGTNGAKLFFQDLALTFDTLSLRVLPLKGRPAYKAGIRRGDRILSIDGTSLPKWEALIQAVQASKGKALRFSWMPLALNGPESEIKEATIIPEPLVVVDFGFHPKASPLRETYKVEGFLPALSAGLVSSMDTIRNLYATLKGIFAARVSSKNLSGIIMISVTTYETAKRGWTHFLFFLAILSLNLAFINILPIPVLDGGHLLFLTIEAIKGSPVSERVLAYSQMIGVVFILGLLLFVTFNDIMRLFR